LEENLRAANVELTPDDLLKLDEATSKVSIQGARYPENLQKLVNR
jgi:aryl-alcohol dehydrogenase-like predicted oxidoreductase